MWRKVNRNLRSIGNHISVSLPTDEKGLISRKCPKSDCLGVFKVKLGTGLTGNNLPCFCPYCGWKGNTGEFNTPEQIEYAKSIVINQITNALRNNLREWGRKLERDTRNSLLKIAVDFKEHHYPIRYYQEKQLETQVTCDICTLEYAIFGVFAYCPDCGTHNSMQILVKNLELVEKEIALANTVEDKELAGKLVDDSLENAVSAFDGFGRATCVAFANKLPNGVQASEISFQNIGGAQTRVLNFFGFDIAKGLMQNDWDFVIRCFQKRHLLAHKMGVIDDEYIKKAKDPQAIMGRKITITPDEVLQLVRLLRIIGNNFFDNLKL
jgi:hypothetical protein